MLRGKFFNFQINKKLYNRFAPHYSRIHKNNHDEVHSFIAEDKVHINKKTFAFSKNIDESISQNLSNVWQLRKDFHFLRRLAWILKQFDDRIEKGDKDKCKCPLIDSQFSIQFKFR